jgi:glycosyltransferase involved in cell wall biosynthesis
MQVLMLPTWFPHTEDQVSGVFVREQARAVAARHDVAVLFLEPHGPLGNGRIEVTREVEEGLLTVRLRAAHGPLRKVWLMLALLAGLRRLRSTGFRPDLVHAHVFRVGAVAVALARISGLPVVVSEHNSLFLRRVATRVELLLARVAFTGADLVAPVSVSLREAIEAYGIRARFRVVPNPVDTRMFHPGERHAGSSRRLLFVGRLVPVKGFPRLVEALAQVAGGAPFELEVIGDGPERGAYERLVQQLALTQRIRFRGGRPREEVALAMREADLCVIASDWETLSCVALEAQASGLPLVAPAVGGIPEVVRDGGVLVAPGDAGALARGIEEALGDQGRFDREAIARDIRARFSAEAIADRWDEAYAETESIARRRPLVRLRAALTR